MLDSRREVILQSLERLPRVQLHSSQILHDVVADVGLQLFAVSLEHRVKGSLEFVA